MQRHFDEELRVLHREILRMGSLVEEALAKSVKALVERNIQLAEEVISSDQAINMLEIEIDELCLRVLALHQPAAADLRFVVMALKINNDLERMGDQAVNIAERTVELLREPLLKCQTDLSRMASVAQGMVKNSLDAFVNRDAALARQVCGRDDEVDRINDQMFAEMIEAMRSDHAAIARGLGLILIGRHLERVADHATNLAEDVIYLVQGRSIKHHLEERQAGSAP